MNGILTGEKLSATSPWRGHSKPTWRPARLSMPVFFVLFCKRNRNCSATSFRAKRSVDPESIQHCNRRGFPPSREWRMGCGGTERAKGLNENRRPKGRL